MEELDFFFRSLLGNHSVRILSRETPLRRAIVSRLLFYDFVRAARKMQSHRPRFRLQALALACSPVGPADSAVTAAFECRRGYVSTFWTLDMSYDPARFCTLHRLLAGVA